MNTQSNPIRIGVLATLYGPFQTLGEDGVRGVRLAVAEHNDQIAGKSIELTTAGTSAVPEDAYDAVQRLIETQGIDFIVGPLSGNEGLAVRNYARTCPDHVFLNGSSGAQELTLRNPAPNFYNFALLGTQCMAGLGTYVYQQGYKRIVTLAEDYSYPHAQIGAFMVEYYRLGGRVVNKLWVALAQNDFSKVIEAIPDDVDAIFVLLGGTDVLEFLAQYIKAGLNKPLIGGAITTDQSILSAQGIPTERLLGVVAGGPTADDNPDPLWKKFVEHYRARFPDGFNYPSYFAATYYINAKAALLALESIGGDLSNGQARFKAALSGLSFNGPCGPVRLDHNRQAIASSFITTVAKDAKGKLHRKLIRVVPDVSQTLGLSEEEYLAIGRFTADNPTC